MCAYGVQASVILVTNNYIDHPTRRDLLSTNVIKLQKAHPEFYSAMTPFVLAPRTAQQMQQLKIALQICRCKEVQRLDTEVEKSLHMSR